MKAEIRPITAHEAEPFRWKSFTEDVALPRRRGWHGYGAYSAALRHSPSIVSARLEAIDTIEETLRALLRRLATSAAIRRSSRKPSSLLNWHRREELIALVPVRAQALTPPNAEVEKPGLN